MDPALKTAAKAAVVVFVLSKTDIDNKIIQALLSSVQSYADNVDPD